MDLLERIANLYQDYMDVYKRFKAEDIIPLPEKGEKEDRYLLISGENKYLLSAADLDLYGKRFNQYYYWKDLACVDVNMPKILHKNCQNDHLGNSKILCVFTYVEGTPVREYLRNADDGEAYRMGVAFGEMLWSIHDAKVDIISHHASPWLHNYRHVHARLVRDYRCHPATDRFLEFYEKNLELLKKHDSTTHYTYKDGVGKDERLLAFVSNEFILENLVVTEDGKPGIKSYSDIWLLDAWYEFRFLSTIAFCNEYFASGIVDGYFGGKIPEDFFGILKLYTCQYVIEEFGKSLSEAMVGQISEYYDHMNAEIPKWYKTNH